MSRSLISGENDRNGSLYQKVVAEHLEKRTGLPVKITETHGIDIICGGKYFVEVKGMKNLFKKPSKKKGQVQVNSWKADQTICPDGLTHFAFVLNEDYLCSQSFIYFVVIEDIKKRFHRKPTSQWVYFPLHWVWDHYILELSYIPLMKAENNKEW